MEKAKEISNEKVIIVISSLMVWNKTPKKWKKKGTPDPVKKVQGEEGEEVEEEAKEEPPAKDEAEDDEER